jgi:YD repeat-containing protein
LALDGATRNLTYDAAGRIQSDSSRSYFYDPRGRLAGVAQNGALVEAYLYDANGRLAAVVSGGTNPVTTTFAYDGEQIVAAYDANGNPLWEAAWGPGLDQLVLWRELSSGVVDFPLVDHRNSVVATWNPDAARGANYRIQSRRATATRAQTAGHLPGRRGEDLLPSRTRLALRLRGDRQPADWSTYALVLDGVRAVLSRST